MTFALYNYIFYSIFYKNHILFVKATKTGNRKFQHKKFDIGRLIQSLNPFPFFEDHNRFRKQPGGISTRRLHAITPWPCALLEWETSRYCAGPHYRLVRRMRSGHSEVVWRYRILSSPLDLHAPCMRTCANACTSTRTRACMLVQRRRRGAARDRRAFLLVPRVQKNRRDKPKESERVVT